MRITTKAWRAALLAPVIVLLAGCSNSSITPGLGGSGGTNTYGGGITDPDETIMFHVIGSDHGDFVATDITHSGVYPNPGDVHAAQDAGVQTNRETRTVTIRFVAPFTTPKALTPRTYSIGTGDDDIGIQYTKQSVSSNNTPREDKRYWTATSGTMTITNVLPDRVDATFTAQMNPAADPLTGKTLATNNLSLTGGVLHLKY